MAPRLLNFLQLCVVYLHPAPAGTQREQIISLTFLGSFSVAES